MHESEVRRFAFFRLVNVIFTCVELQRSLDH